MGQAGSVEQKNAIRDIVSLKVGSSDKAPTLQALQTFCEMFPLEVRHQASQMCLCMSAT